jgi:hypothetical protein
VPLSKTASKTYYALVKVKGKQHKRSLKTFDLAEAKRKLREHRADQAELPFFLRSLSTLG